MSVLIKKHPETDRERTVGLIHRGNMLATEQVRMEIAADCPDDEDDIIDETFGESALRAYFVEESEMVTVFQELGQLYIDRDSPDREIQFALESINRSEGVRSLIGLVDGAQCCKIDYEDERIAMFVEETDTGRVAR